MIAHASHSEHCRMGAGGNRLCDEEKIEEAMRVKC